MGQKITLSGKTQASDTSTTLRLINPKRGVDIKIPVNKDRSFSASVNIPYKGIYHLTGVSNLYLVPGKNIQINPTPEPTKYEYSGPGALENNIMLSIPAERKTLPIGGDIGIPFYALNSEASYFLDRLEKYKQNINAKLSTSSDPFFKKIMEGDVNNASLSLLRNYRKYYGFDSLVMRKMTVPATNNYYKTEADKMKLFAMQAYAVRANFLTKEDITKIDALLINEFNWNDEDLFYNSPSYLDNIQSNLDDRTQRLPREQQALTKLELADKLIQNPAIKNYIKGFNGLSYLKESKDAVKTDSVYQVLTTLSLAPDLRKQIEDQYRNYAKLKSDPQSLDFAYKTIDDKIVTLKSLRGKYVYIDLWATWCAPCKVEIPFLQKIEEEYKNKNIHIVSISLDRQNDKKKWQDYVKDNKLTGIQIMADKDFSSDFIQTFQVASIPRFILIDPEGKVVSADAARPSNPELKTQLNKLLK